MYKLILVNMNGTLYICCNLFAMVGALLSFRNSHNVKTQTSRFNIIALIARPFYSPLISDCCEICLPCRILKHKFNIGPIKACRLFGFSRTVYDLLPVLAITHDSAQYIKEGSSPIKFTVCSTCNTVILVIINIVHLI